MAVDQGGPRAGAGGAGEQPGEPADAGEQPGPAADAGAAGEQAAAASPGQAADPDRIATQQDFGRELTRARQRAGRTVREVARAVGIPAEHRG